jgi:hypothetical protein
MMDGRPDFEGRKEWSKQELFSSRRRSSGVVTNIDFALDACFLVSPVIWTNPFPQPKLRPQGRANLA